MYGNMGDTDVQNVNQEDESRTAAPRSHANREHEDDAQLVKACLANDDSAWTAFYARFKPMCLIVARKYNCAPEFDDLFSDFIVKLLGGLSGKAGALHKYHGTVSLKTYLSTVFRYLVIDFHRKRRRRVAIIHAEKPVEDYADSVCDQEQQSDSEMALSMAIARLSKYERKIVDLYYYNELTMQQTAEVLNCHKSKVSRELKAIHKRLKALVEEDME